MNQKKNENKLNKAGKTILYTFILMVVMGIFSDASGSVIAVAAVVLVAAGVGILGFYFARKAKAAKTEETVTRSYTTHDSSQPRKYDPAEIKDREEIEALERASAVLPEKLDGTLFSSQLGALSDFVARFRK